MFTLRVDGDLYTALRVLLLNLLLLPELLLCKSGIFHNLLIVVDLVLLQRHDILLIDLLLVSKSSRRVLLVVHNYLLPVRFVVPVLHLGLCLILKLRLLHHLLVAWLHLNELLN